MRVLYSLTVLLLATSVFGQAGNDPKDDEISRLFGDWSGESVCLDKKKFPACKDETVVYHFTKVAEKSDTVHVSADKIVNGKPESMGEHDFVYVPKAQTLVSEYRNDRVHFIMEFRIMGETMDGTMKNMPDRSLIRRITLKKISKPK